MDEEWRRVEAGRPTREAFVAFVREVEPRLRIAVVAARGPGLGLDAVQETLIWAWEHWDRVTRLDNPAGYLYRVAMRKASRANARRPVVVPALASDTTPWVVAAAPNWCDACLRSAPAAWPPWASAPRSDWSHHGSQRAQRRRTG